MADTAKAGASPEDKARHQKIAAGLEKAVAEMKKIESQLSTLDGSTLNLEKVLE
jgi:hypothetical protein